MIPAETAVASAVPLRSIRFTAGKRADAMALVALAALALAALAFAASTNAAEAARPRLPTIRLKLDDGADQPAYSGRVFVIFSQDDRREPRHKVGWFNREPIVAFEIAAWKSGSQLTLADQRLIEFALEPSGLPSGSWQVQAVVDRNRTTHEVLNAVGNGFSKPARLEWNDAGGESVMLTIDQTVPGRTPTSNDTRKHSRIESRLLSQFHGTRQELRANVFLPKDYENEAQQKFPTLYAVSGFGDSDFGGTGAWYQRLLNDAELSMVVVHIVADCPTGHHAFADSANNGPVGTALVEELIPALEREYRLIPESAARYVTGHSSGGWSSLWLQVAFPETFGGCWSTAPDPVDFTAFQTVDIYAPNANMFTDEAGKPRPISRPGRRGQLMARQFCELEEVLGRGGQLQSFEAVFSPRGEGGKPRQLWDRSSGTVDPEVASAWRKFDIADRLRREWPTLGPKLAGKLHIWCGDIDTFHLETAVMRLKKSLAELGSDAEVTIFPDTTHGFSPKQMKEVIQNLADHERKRQPSATAGR